MTLNWSVETLGDECDMFIVTSDPLMKTSGADLRYLKGGWLRKVFEKSAANKL